MKATEQRIRLGGSSIRLALVQLDNPFSPERRELVPVPANGKNPPRFRWRDDNARDERSEKVQAVLERLSALKLRSGNFNVIAFPEYSVPKECHGVFQEYSDRNSCIIVPGSYYEQDGPWSRHNVCSIYRPNDEPVLIGKSHPFDSEKSYLDENVKLPSVAHLIWDIGDGEERSLSVYVCKDYLCAFDPERHSLHDWQRPGLNLVVMLSPQTWLFEAQASLDIRRLPAGEGRFVALCNCAAAATDDSPTGSALIGPAREAQERGGDLIERLAPHTEGVLAAELDLSRRVSVTEERPNRETFNPLRWIASSRIVADPNGAWRLDALETAPPRRRGVWHPAFLDLIHRNIRIQLYRSRKYDHVRDLAVQSKFRYVSAAALLGGEDFLFRLYEAAGEETTLSSIPYFRLSKEEFRDSFEADAPLEFVVGPRQIYKYRTAPIPHLDAPKATFAAEWEKTKRRIDMVLPARAGPERQHVLAKACRLARDWGAGDILDAERDQLAPIFLKEREEVPRLGPESGNHLRQRFVLVSIPTDARVETLERIIRAWLVPRREVRSIYRITHKTEVGSEGVQFQFWLDMIAEPHEADKLIIELKRRAVTEDPKLLIGTRSIDVIEHIRHESVEGIAVTDWGYDMRDFWAAINDDPEVRVHHNPDELVEHYNFVLEYAGAFSEQFDQLKGVSPEMATYVSQFYKCFLYGNCVRIERDARRLRVTAKSAWTNAYQMLERLCTNKLTAYGTPGELTDLIREVFKAGNEKVLTRMENSIVRLVWMTRHKQETLKGIDDLGDIRKAVDALVDVRNRLSHGEHRGMSPEDWLYVLDKSEDGPQRSAQIAQATRLLARLFIAVRGRGSTATAGK